jgi:outer membrane receptor protein involved in Fe transport
LIQNKILKYRSQGYSAGSSINAVPFSFIGINYSFLWRHNKSFTVEHPERFFPIKETSQNVQINVFPTKTLTVIIRAEHQYNSAIINGNRYTSFADAGVKFKRKTLDMELEFNNIFNSKQYVSASYSDINTYYYYTYNLRPANILLRIRFKLK